MNFFRRLFRSQQHANTNIIRLNPDEFKKAISKNSGRLLDVRTKKEFDTGSIPGAINQNLIHRNSFLKAVLPWSKSEHVFLYCQSGIRSMKAARLLSRNGFTKIYELKAGISNYDL
ncbi:rhodanese-like domain-containing protein [Christiangramia portivictoriae]|uniref:rhodanese-like domain-containing protein n=1 Tax=Christiangramia portivictoriae TaxID=326069 RepID=UPI00041BF5D2|nr:rhodanese-like domain-containing protein [Christiangramia portivictoriae]